MSSRLQLEDCREDSPQTRALINVFEQDSETLSTFATNLSLALQRITDAQNELEAATQSLSQHVRSFENTSFSLHDDDDFIKSAFHELASKIDQVASFNTVLYTQLSESALYYIARFVAKDLAEFKNLKSKFQNADKIHSESTKRLLKISKRKVLTSELSWQEATDHLHAARQAFHTTSMAYCSQLNLLQERKKIGLLQPLVGYVQSQMSFFNMGSEMCQKDLEEFLNKLSQSIATIENNIAANIKKDQELQDKLDAESTRHYLPDPPPSMDLPELPVNKALTQISGYLFVRSRTAFLTQWNQFYFFTQGGNLMQQGKKEVAGGLVIDLDSCMVAHADVDDRRNVFQVTSKDGKHTVYLQAEGKYNADTWIATLENISAGLYLENKSEAEDGEQNPAVLATTGVIETKATPAPGNNEERSTEFEEKHEAFRPSAMFERIKNAASSLLPSQPQQQRTPSTSENIERESSTSDLEAVVNEGNPILFDLPLPTVSTESEATNERPKELGSPLERENPFTNDKMEELSLQDETESSQGSNYRAMYVVRFIGCQQITKPITSTHGVISDTIRKVMAARALHNVFSMNELHLVVKNNTISLVDPATQLKRDVFNVNNIVQAANHRENTRLFGFIVRSTAEQDLHTCYAFESNSDGADICCAIATAQVMVQSGIEYEEIQRQKNVEQQLEEESKMIAHSTDPQDGDGEQNEKNIEMAEPVDGAGDKQITDSGGAD